MLMSHANVKDLYNYKIEHELLHQGLYFAASQSMLVTHLEMA